MTAFASFPNLFSPSTTSFIAQSSITPQRPPPRPPRTSSPPCCTVAQTRSFSPFEQNGATYSPPLSPPPPSTTTTTSKDQYIQQIKDTMNAMCVGAADGDTFWQAMQDEAREAASKEPLLASFLFATVLNHRSLISALSFHLANKLAADAMPSTMLMQLCREGFEATDGPCSTLRRDLLAVMERDPACTQLTNALLYFKGFHALQGYRVAHWLWNQGRRPLAYYLQSQISKNLQVDIHPAATIGPGAFIDHATGVVIGETARLGSDVSMLHHVTLGGTGRRHGIRHPKICDGVLIGAGATVLGDITVGEGAQIGACSLVLKDVPPHATCVGVPARVVSTRGVGVPAMEMKHERCLQHNGVTNGDETATKEENVRQN